MTTLDYFQILALQSGGQSPFTAAEKKYISDNLLIISGPKASGKTTICAILSADYSMRFIPLITTRSKRRNEIEGRDLLYYDHDLFQYGLRTKEFLIAYRIRVSLNEWKETGISVYSFKAAIRSGKKILISMSANAIPLILNDFPNAKVIIVFPGDHQTLVAKRPDIQKIADLGEQTVFGTLNEAPLLPLSQIYFVENKPGEPERTAQQITEFFQIKKQIAVPTVFNF